MNGRIHAGVWLHVQSCNLERRFLQQQPIFATATKRSLPIWQVWQAIDRGIKAMSKSNPQYTVDTVLQAVSLALDSLRRISIYP